MFDFETEEASKYMRAFIRERQGLRPRRSMCILADKRGRACGENGVRYRGCEVRPEIEKRHDRWDDYGVISKTGTEVNRRRHGRDSIPPLGPEHREGTLRRSLVCEKMDHR